jgi:uncharacterized membrane protein SpoIIM required for sporulation
MDYHRFLRLRGPIWEAFEEGLARSRKSSPPPSHDDVELQAFRYRQVLHDFALARERFPGTRAAQRLSSLALAGAYALQRDYEPSRFGIVSFFLVTFPRAFRKLVPHIAIASSIFAVAALFGFFTATLQPGMGLALLGPEAMEDLRQGHLWTESLSSVVPPSVTSSAIATNNMSVAITGWAGGALFGLGALYVLLLNGLMLGAVFGVTSHFALSGALFEFVVAHGFLEITLILVSAAAGLSMGRALVEAGELPRRESLPLAARSALVVLLGCLPWFLVLGLVEAFVSPAPAVPFASKVLLGLALESFFLVAALNPFLREPER